MPKEKNQPEENYTVSARKYRPKTFEDVTAQDYITKTLLNAIKINRVSHAYLFCGPRGVGKTTIARLMAKSLNCKNRKPNGEPCNECDSCKEINNDNRNHPDVFEIDGASNRNIEDVRELKEKVKYGPVRSRYKIFIIDEVHMLTGASFNALLKTLEEPPSYVIFIFATTAPEKVPLTILGRCQKFDFKRFTIEEIISRLKFIAKKENIKIDEESLFFIAKKGDGSMRDAQGLFDMASAYSDSNITFDNLKSFFNLAESDVYFNITTFIKAKDGQGVLNYFDELINKGYDMQTFLDGLTEHYRNLLIACSTGSSALVVESEAIKQKYEESIQKFTQIELLNSLKLILQTEYSFKYSANQRTLIEALLIELMKFTDTREISAILEELKDLKSGSESTFEQVTGPKKTQPKLASEEKVTFTAVYSSPDKSVNESVQSFKEPDSAPAGEDQVKAEKPAAKLSQALGTVVDISTALNDLNSHWTTIKDHIKTERKWVHSILKDTTFELDGKSNYCIKVDDNRYDLLDSYKDYLTGVISNYFGQPLPINVVKNSDFISSRSNDELAKEEIDNFEQIKSILIKEFNAREVK
ncbi:MAG TPA: DNA polymerase III subunit gamma/tau [Ignavibacteria bacterium]|jgi:DNA polymerase-3 subunit gamma/tau